MARSNKVAALARRDSWESWLEAGMAVAPDRKLSTVSELRKSAGIPP